MAEPAACAARVLDPECLLSSLTAVEMSSGESGGAKTDRVWRRIRS